MRAPGPALVGRALLVCAVLAGSRAGAETLRVGPTRPLRTIGQALQAAAAGDTVLVERGEYRENLRLERPVRLLGEAMPAIVGKRDGDVVQVIADDVEIAGFELRESGGDMVTSDAAVMIAGARAHVHHNRMVDNHYGVYLRMGCDAVLEENTVQGRPEVDVGERGAGFHLYDAHRNRIRKNRVSFVRDGVYFDHADFNVVEDNEFSDLRYGVHYMFCNRNEFYRNIFRDSMAGVAIMNTEHITFSDNVIVHNRTGHNAFGLLLKDCSHSVAERNVIADNVHGVFLEGAYHNRLSNNLIAYNDVAIYMYASARHNTFSENDFVGNLATLHTVGRAKATWASGSRGNYYSDYGGYDLDGDGVGDVAHRLQDAFEHLQGNHPLLRLFLSSAAADALAAAERSFPVIPGGDERDAFPLVRPASRVRSSLLSAREPGARGWLLASVSLLASVACLGVMWRMRA
jgi:nitrous oxidase accessory protein